MGGAGWRVGVSWAGGVGGVGVAVGARGAVASVVVFVLAVLARHLRGVLLASAW